MTSSFAGDPPSMSGDPAPCSGDPHGTIATTKQPQAEPETGTQDGMACGSGDLSRGSRDAVAVAADAAAPLHSIGELAGDFGVTTRAIRFYEAKKLITPIRKGTARLYTRRDRARLQMILRGKNLGFSLEEIREFLDLYDADPAQTVQTKHLLGKVDVAITELENKRADIERTLSELAQIRKECLDHLDGET